LEHFGILAEVLFVGCPMPLSRVVAWLVVRVLHIEVYRGDVVVINPVLDILEVFVGLWHTDLSKFLFNLVCWVLSAILDPLINAV